MNNRVLVVDDEPMILEILSRRLEIEGYVVYTESRAEPAFELFQETKPFLTLCDLRLENHIDGATLAGKIRRADPYAILICLTGALTSFDKGYLLGSGTFTDILLKPIDTPLLLRVTKYASNKYERWKSY